MSRIPLSDEGADPTENEHLFLDDTDFDDHYDELDFDLDPFETDDETIEDERDYGSDA